MIYDTFPAAKEDLRLSLAVSLVGGVFGGFAAAVASNPADCTISEMKKKRKGGKVGEVEAEAATAVVDEEKAVGEKRVGPVSAAKQVYGRDGPGGFFR